MKPLLLATLLVGAVLAGCASQDDSDGADDARLAFDVPEVPAVDAAAVLADLQAFASTYSERADNLPAHEGAREWLAEQFDAAGLQVWRQDFEDGIPQQNVVGIHWGTVRDQWVVVGAHYDMVTTDCAVQCATRDRSQGAYDDGSGTLMTVHLAKAFAQVDTYYTIAFVAFDGEERGLQGSNAFVQAILDGDHDLLADDGMPLQVTFRGMVDLDMIGLNWPGVDAPIYLDQNSPELLAEAQRLAGEIGIPEDMVLYQGIRLGRSDYAHFFALGVPTAFFISDFESWQMPADAPVVVPPQPDAAPDWAAYPFWHIADTWDTMVLMAGSEEDLRAGFQTALDFSGGLLHYMALQPDVQLTGQEM